MRLILFVFFIVSSLGAEDFITPLEYGKMLYQNPRGIGCDRCHGLKGEGKIIAYYKKKGKVKKLVAPAINGASKKVFLRSLTKKSNVMPKYFLTKYEMQSLYDYIKSVNEKGKK